MCGLCGIITTEKDDEKYTDVLIELLHSNALRGMDATGVAGISRSKKGYESVLYKRAVASPEYIQLRGFDRNILDNIAAMNVIMGHTRAKTYGNHVDSDAHPFQHGKIILAHNGSLINKGGLTDYDPSIIDSENIALNMSKHPELDVLQALYGAYALTWFNAEDGTFNIARNNGRPLSVAWEKDKNTMYWSSESAMLLSVLSRNSVNVETLAVLKSGKHFKFTLDDVRKYSVTAFKEYEAPKAPAQVMGQKSHWFNQHAPGPQRSRKGAATPGEILNAMGLRRNERVIVQFSSYSQDCKLNNPEHKRGKIYGTIQAGSTHIPVVIHNTNERVYKSTKYAICEIVGAYKDMTHGNVAIASFKEAAAGAVMLPTQDTRQDGDIYWPKSPSFHPRPQLPHGVCYSPTGAQISVERFLALVDDGCAKCMKIISVMESPDIFWSAEQTPRPICRRCMVEHQYPSKESA